MKILVVPMFESGHINASLGLAVKLKNRGHQVVYATEASNAGVFEKHGFQEVLFNECARAEDKGQNETWEGWFETAISTIRLKPTEQYPLTVGIYERSLLRMQHGNQQMDRIVKLVKPDVIVQDVAVRYPSLFKCGIPIAFLYPLSPLFILENESLPPRWTGLPLQERPEDTWRHHREVRDDYIHETWSQMNSWLVQNGVPPLSRDNFWYSSTNLNLLMYPQPLLARYLKQASTSLKSTWMCVDHCIRPTSEVFEIPEKLRYEPGKLIYVSMGTLGAADTSLMKRLLDALSESGHRFIVNTGKYHNLYELPQNVYGESFLPQLAVLPLVDLVVTHGGNNTFIETLYFGKPMVVTPLFTDQFDNARMAVEAEIGVQFLPYQEPMNTLLDKIEQVLNNDNMQKKVMEMSVQIRCSDALEQAVKRIEALSKSYNQPFVISPPDPHCKLHCDET